MKRRNFIGSLVGVPFVAMFGQSLLEAQETQKEHVDIYEIMSPKDIARFWTYVPNITFKANNQVYFIKTWMLKAKAHSGIFRIPIDSFDSQLDRTLVFGQVVDEINELGLTHVHCVAYNTYSDLELFGRCNHAYVCGAKV